MRYINDTCVAAAFRLLRQKGLKISAAESCTGGMFTKLLTDFAGSSEVLDLSMVTYANGAKVKFLGVPQEDIDAHGVVSREVAAKMAEGICKAFGADVGVGITGIAGPGGGSDEKPVGLVWTAVHYKGKTHTCALRLSGSRGDIREKTCLCVYTHICDILSRE